ncbi:hypothetical protein DSO57_1030565 [Entomophthora muscae]|uniref:Uncharacterized protein n=1 Tax=Entomophthora muscae TaxID=34485 RepID=A0ACC2UAC5_9FUNG|nr:hypothetical protein DSO57_1030565 [Entomophthora muscae]
MSDKGRGFIGNEFTRLLKVWYRPTEGLAPAESQVHTGYACLVIGKVLEEFEGIQARYKLLAGHLTLLENDNSSKPVPGYDPGHTLGTDDQEPHSPSTPLEPSNKTLKFSPFSQLLISCNYHPSNKGMY